MKNLLPREAALNYLYSFNSQNHPGFQCAFKESELHWTWFGIDNKLKYSDLEYKVQEVFGHYTVFIGDGTDSCQLKFSKDSPDSLQKIEKIALALESLGASKR